MKTLLMHMRTCCHNLSDKILLSILLSCVMLASTAIAKNPDDKKLAQSPVSEAKSQAKGENNTLSIEQQTEESSLSKTGSDIHTQKCPKSFYKVKLPNNGKLCQVFATQLPASMILFVPQTPNEVVKFFKQDPSEFSTSKQVKQRYLLQSRDKNTTLIISPDGKGTQVDVLVIGEQNQVLAKKQ